jgi:hypothetical protein
LTVRAKARPLPQDPAPGPYSALAANADLCANRLYVPSEFTAQNGALSKQRTPIKVTGCRKHKLTRHHRLLKALKACHRRHGRHTGGL